MDLNIKAVKYYDDGYRFGILVRDDERRQHIIPIEVGKEIRVKKFRTYMEQDVVTEYFDDDTLAKLVAKITELGARWGITEEAKRYLV